MRHPGVFSALVILALAPAAWADPLDDAPLDDGVSHYLITLPQTDVRDAAEVVLGETLGLPFKVDEDVRARMTLAIDGAYAPKDLAREFGYRLWNADVALVETAAGGLWLIPKGELNAALGQGAELVAPPAGFAVPDEPSSANSAAALPAASPPAPNGFDWTWLGWLAGGWVAGAATVWAGLRLRARPRPRPLGALPAPLPPTPPLSDSDPGDLVIPIFSSASSREPQP